MKIKLAPRLTLKAAKAIAIAEVGTASELTPHENNRDDYQRYEMQLGKYTVVVSSDTRHWGYAVISCGSNEAYYKISTLESSNEIADLEREASRDEMLKGIISWQCGKVIKYMLEEYDYEDCRKWLDEAAKEQRKSK